MFHAVGGIFFGRKENGEVRILKLSDKLAYWPLIEGKYPDAEIDVTLPLETWASVVCSVSKRGENANRFREALNFHGAGED